MIISVFITGFLALAGFLTLRLPSFGALSVGNRLKRIRNSKNFKNGKFLNEEDTPMMSADASYPKMMAKFFAKDPLREPQKPLPTVKPVFLPPPTDDSYRLIWFGHSSYLLQIAHITYTCISYVSNSRKSKENTFFYLFIICKNRLIIQ